MCVSERVKEKERVKVMLRERDRVEQNDFD
jgi:hypothetical protein